jgi:hypothetical protein
VTVDASSVARRQLDAEVLVSYCFAYVANQI